MCLTFLFIFFFFNDTATTEIYTLSLHDALPIYPFRPAMLIALIAGTAIVYLGGTLLGSSPDYNRLPGPDRKSTRLNSSHGYISYAVFCLKKKKQKHKEHRYLRRSTSTCIAHDLR